MPSSILTEKMPTSGYYGTSSSYRNFTSTASLSRRQSPAPTTRVRAYDTGGNYGSYASTLHRRLPSGPGPLDTHGNRLKDYNLTPLPSYKTHTSTPSKTGPLKAQHTSFGSSVSRLGGVSSNVMAPSSSSSGRYLASRRSSSLADLTNSSTRDSYTSRTPYVTADHSSATYNSNFSSGFSHDDPGKTRRVSMTDKDPTLRSYYTGSYNHSLSSTQSAKGSSSPSPTINSAANSDMSAESSNRSTLQQSSLSRNSPVSSAISKYEHGGKVGLQNLGNTCFMNSVLQCLSNTRPLLLYCLNDDYHLDINTSTSSMKGALIKAYVSLMQSMWKEKTDSYVCPKMFKTQIQKFAPRFTGYAQQDAQEFLRYLLEGLHEDVNRVTQKSQPIVLDDSVLEKKSDADKALEYWKAYLALDNSRIVEIFVGQLRSELKFTVCKHRSVTFDPFWDLSLPIPKGRSEVSLEDCLRLFMKEEELEDEERPICAKCKARQSCTKSFSIQKFPPILVLHLKRFSQERFGRKLSTMIEYPVTHLDLSSYAADSCTSGGRVMYNLYGVSCHSGGVHSGHYTAICRHPFTGEWINFNDSRATTVRSNQAITSEGYLLFYELTTSLAKL